MKIKYLGHSAFKITSDSGASVVTDPYTPGDMFKYDTIKELADVVTSSHEHFDHNYTAGVRGAKVVKDVSPVEVKGIKVKGVAAFHDETQGGQRGKDIIYCMDMDGIRVCHLGDLGHQLSSVQLAEMGKVDILLVPVGGTYTLDAGGATKLCDAVKPKVIIPMHFKTPKTDLPLAPVDDFLRAKNNITHLGGSETEFKKDKLPASTQIIVLKPAM